MSTENYFASAPSLEIGDEIMKKVDNFYQHITTSGRLLLWRKAFKAYYINTIMGAGINKSGAQGEYVTININHYRNLLLHLKSMTVSNRPAFEAKAVNSDHKSLSQAILANGLLEYYMKEKGLENNIKDAVEYALVLGESYIRARWEVSSGEQYAVNPDTGAAIFEGDLVYDTLLPIDVIRDYTKSSAKDHQWYIIRSSQNRFDLSNKYPELADKILSLPSKLESDHTHNLQTVSPNEISEDIYVYEFYHSPTPAIPQGRLVMCLSSDIVLLDGSLPYSELPVYRMAPENVINSPFGFSVSYDLLPIQEAVNMLYSTVTTNNSAFGVQNIIIPTGNNINVSSLSGGMNFIEYDAKAGKPEPLQLTRSAPETYAYIKQLEQVMETLSGVNSVSRGNPDSSLKSGAALALVAQQGIAFSMNLQQSYTELLEAVGTGTVNILKEYASVPRIARIVGKANKSNMKEFTADDISQVSRVSVESANALSKTTAGRVQLAETLIQNGLIANAQEYLSVIQTGTLQPLIEGETAELMLIRDENEQMSDGAEQIAILTDNHSLHIKEHKSILASSDSRRNPEIVQIALAHIQQHINLLSDPNNASTFSILGYQSLQQPQIQGNTTPVSQTVDATNPVTQQANKVKMPNIPESPIKQ